MPDLAGQPSRASTFMAVFSSNHSSTETLTVEPPLPERKVDADKGKSDCTDEAPINTVSQLEKGNVALTVDDSFPDGGWEAWGCIFGCWWMIFFSFGSVNSFGVYEEYYAAHLLPNKTISQIAWIGSFQFFFVFGTGIIAGRAFDLGYLKPVLAVSTVMLVVCQIMVSLCTEYWQLFLAQGVGLGLAMGFIFGLCIGVPSHWFKRRRATAMGILASGAGAGSTVLPIVVRELIPAVGFPWTMRIIGFASMIVLSGCYFLIKTRLPASKVDSAGHWVDLSAFQMKSFTFFVIGAAMCMFGMYTPQTFMNTFTSVHNIRGNGYWLSVLNASSTFGRVLPGILADRYGKMTTIIPHLCIATIFLFLFPLFDNLSIIVFAIIYGYCSGCYVSLVPTCVNQLGDTQNAGSRMGALFSLMSIAGLFGTPLAGLIMGDAPYRWWACVGFSGACVSIGLVFIVISRQFATRHLNHRP